MLIWNLALGMLTMVVCLLLQLTWLILAFGYYKRNYHRLESTLARHSIILITMVLLILVTGILGQIAAWALLFVWLQEFSQFSAAFYHSAVNFGSLGYGDIVMSERYRLLGALEAINGVLMIGVATAALMTVFKDAMQKTRVHGGKGGMP